jgi:hypothetical protein
MEIDAIKSFDAKARWNKFSQWCINTWTTIITIGITDEFTDWEKKRTRLLNGIAAMGFIALSIYCLMYLDKAHRLTFWESFQGWLLWEWVLLLNYFRKHSAACHFFNIYNIVVTHFSPSHMEVWMRLNIFSLRQVLHPCFFSKIKLL